MGQVRIPTIVVSGFDDPVLHADARAFGADYLVKPVQASALLALIDQKLAPRDVPPADAATSQLDTGSL